jgi:hypothetical protein
MNISFKISLIGISSPEEFSLIILESISRALNKSNDLLLVEHNRWRIELSSVNRIRKRYKRFSYSLDTGFYPYDLVKSSYSIFQWDNFIVISISDI